MREAFWNLVSAQVNLKEREAARGVIRDDLKMVTEQYVLDLAVKQQFLAVKAEYLKANTQFNEARKNISQARWKLAKALGLKKPPDFELETHVPFKKIEIDMEECLLLAETHRPDLFMQKRLVETARQGRRVAQSSLRPKVSVNGFYGRSGAAFETETLNYREDWQVNARLTQRFLGSSVGLSGNAIHTSPKLGQSSRTETETKGVNVNILDGMRDRTDRKQSDLAFRQARLKLDDLTKEVAMDVENAYYSLNQSLLQVEFSEEDVKLAEEELKVAESKRKYGLAGVLEVARARNRAAESRTARTSALTSYQVSLAVLNRAVGITDKFIVE